jgi:predicted nuclease of predicted toxin-antitoxin system
MNLSPEWRPFLEENGFEAVHWSVIGDGNASDETIMQWARDHEHVVLTHDLDFGVKSRLVSTSLRPCFARR